MNTISYLNVSKRKGNLKPNQFKFKKGANRPNIIISNNNSKHINKSTNINFTNTSIISGYLNKSYRPIKLTLNTFNPNKNNKSISLNINHRHGHKQNNNNFFLLTSNSKLSALSFES